MMFCDLRACVSLASIHIFFWMLPPVLLASAADDDLIAAVRDGNGEMALAAIKAGADVNAPRPRPLVEAVKADQKEMVILLLNAGANVKLRDGNDCSALTWAVVKKNFRLAELLIAKGAELNPKDGSSPFVLAASLGNIEIVKIMISAKVDLGSVDSQGNTALHRAASAGHLDVVKVLLDSGADVNIQNKHRRTALSVAKTAEIADAIRDFKASKSAKK